MAEDNGIQVLVGVSGGGAIDGESGKHIEKQLNEIAEAISKKGGIQVKVGVDASSVKASADAIKKQFNNVSLDVDPKIKGADKIADSLKEKLKGVQLEVGGQAAFLKNIKVALDDSDKMVKATVNWKNELGEVAEIYKLISTKDANGNVTEKWVKGTSINYDNQSILKRQQQDEKAAREASRILAEEQTQEAQRVADARVAEEQRVSDEILALRKRTWEQGFKEDEAAREASKILAQEETNEAKRIADARAAEEKRVADEILTSRKRIWEQGFRDDDATREASRILAEEEAAESKRIADIRIAEEQRVADEELAARKRVWEQGFAEDEAAAEASKILAEEEVVEAKRIADAKLAEEQRVAEETLALRRRTWEQGFREDDEKTAARNKELEQLASKQKEYNNLTLQIESKYDAAKTVVQFKEVNYLLERRKELYVGIAQLAKSLKLTEEEAGRFLKVQLESDKKAADARADRDRNKKVSDGEDVFKTQLYPKYKNLIAEARELVNANGGEVAQEIDVAIKKLQTSYYHLGETVNTSSVRFQTFYERMEALKGLVESTVFDTDALNKYIQEKSEAMEKANAANAKKESAAIAYDMSQFESEENEILSSRLSILKEMTNIRAKLYDTSLSDREIANYTEQYNEEVKALAAIDKEIEARGLLSDAINQQREIQQQLDNQIANAQAKFEGKLDKTLSEEENALLSKRLSLLQEMTNLRAKLYSTSLSNQEVDNYVEQYNASEKALSALDREIEARGLLSQAISQQAQVQQQLDTQIANAQSKFEGKADETFSQQEQQRADAVKKDYEDLLRLVKEREAVEVEISKLSKANQPAQYDDAAARLEKARTDAEAALNKVMNNPYAQSVLDMEQIAALNKEVENSTARQATNLAIAKDKLLPDYTKTIEQAKTLEIDVKNLVEAFKALDNATSINGKEFTNFTAQIDNVKQAIEAVNKAKEDSNKQSNATHEFNMLENQFKAIMRISSKIKLNPSLNAEAKAITAEIARLKSAGIESGEAVDKLRNRIQEFNAAARASGANAQTLGDKFKTAFQKISQWYGATQIFMKLIQVVRKGISAVKELDEELITLQKVSNASDREMSAFLQQAKKDAVELSVSITNLTKATSEFAKLGYGMGDAAELGKVATVFFNVGDDVDSIQDASQSLVSSMKAFNIEAKNTIGIADKFNEIGNKYAISSGGASVALAKSASVLAAANNDINQSLALITASNEIVNNPEVVGEIVRPAA